MDVKESGGVASGNFAYDDSSYHGSSGAGRRPELVRCEEGCQGTTGPHLHVMKDGNDKGPPYSRKIDAKRAMKILRDELEGGSLPTITVTRKRKERGGEAGNALEELAQVDLAGVGAATGAGSAVKLPFKEPLQAPPEGTGTVEEPVDLTGGETGGAVGAAVGTRSAVEVPFTELLTAPVQIAETLKEPVNLPGGEAGGATGAATGAGSDVKVPSIELLQAPTGGNDTLEEEDAISRMPGTRANPEPAATAPAPSASTPPLPQPPSPDSFVPTPIRPTARVVPTTLPLTDLKLAQSVDLTEGEAGRAVVAATGASSTVKVPFVEVLQGKGTDAAEEVSDDAERLRATKASQSRSSTSTSTPMLKPASQTAEDNFLRKGPLSTEHESQVNHALDGGSDEEVLVTAFNTELTRRDLKCLLPETWLNDEVVNMYLQLLQARDKKLCQANPDRRPSYFFNSFFFTKLGGPDGKNSNYEGVRQWTRKVKVFEMDKVFVPVNVSSEHWCLAVIYIQKKRINYYDSTGGRGTSVTDALLLWLQRENKDKNGDNATFVPDNWTTAGTDAASTPQQENDNDCGVFTVSFASYISDNLPLDFRQADITQMRRRMLCSLLNQRLV